MSLEQKINICCWKPLFIPYQSRVRTSLIIQSSFFVFFTNTFWRPVLSSSEKNMREIWEHLVIWVGSHRWGRDHWAAQQSQCRLSSWSWPEERWWSNSLEAKLGLGLHRPKVAPQKSLVWQPSPWFDSHHLQVRAAEDQDVGGRMFPFWAQGSEW